MNNTTKDVNKKSITAEKTPDDKTNPTTLKKPRMRSPNYPMYNLEHSLSLVESLKPYHPQYVPRDILAKLWHFKESSGQIFQVMATLNSYGLIDTEGHGEKRKIRASESAARIIRNAPDRSDLLKKAALQPKIFKAIWDKYQDTGLPTKDLLAHELQWGDDLNYKFENTRAINTVITTFFDSVKSAKLDTHIDKFDTDDNLDAPSLGGDIMENGAKMEKRDEEKLQTVEPHPDYFTMQSKEVGMLRLRYPLTKEKLNIIQEFLKALEAELERVESESIKTA